MATGFDRCLEAEPVDVYGNCCTPCADDKLSAQASFYCRNCSKLFCDACVKYHNKIIKGHLVMGWEDAMQWGDVKAVTPAMMCERHPDKEEDMYCADHDITCCHTCIKISHKACKEVKHVSEVAKGIQKAPEFQSFLTNASRTQTGLRNLLDKRVRNIELLQKARIEKISSFKDMRKSFNQFMDNVEKESTTEMDNNLSALYRTIQADIDSCSTFEKEIQNLLDGLKRFGSQCKDFAFQCLKRCAKKMSSAEELLSSMVDEDYQLNFTPDDRIQQLLSSLKTLGKFYITRMDLPSDNTYTVDTIQTVDVSTMADTEKCAISGMCQLPNGQLAVVDHNNNKVKLLSSSKYSVLAEHDMPAHPDDICTTNGTELVVTVSLVSGKKLAKSELHFINAAGGHLTHKAIKRLDHQCIGIAFHKDELYVSSAKVLWKYSLSAEKLTKIYEDTSSKGITVYRFAVSDDGNNIYVTNFAQNCLVTLDKSGKWLSVLTDPELQKPRGICVADNGSVLVCGKTSIIQVESAGKKKMATLVKQSDEVCTPVSLCYDNKTKQLRLGKYNQDNLFVLKLK